MVRADDDVDALRPPRSVAVVVRVAEENEVAARGRGRDVVGACRRKPAAFGPSGMLLGTAQNGDWARRAGRSGAGCVARIVSRSPRALIPAMCRALPAM